MIAKFCILLTLIWGDLKNSGKVWNVQHFWMREFMHTLVTRGSLHTADVKDINN